MKQIWNVLLLLFLASCMQVEATQSSRIVTAIVNPTNTSLPPTPIPSTTPTRSVTCDLLRVDYCLSEGTFIFQRPIHPPANYEIDPSYRYGSTADGTRAPHHGVEFVNPSGTPVYAAADGTVLFAGADQEAIYSPWTDFYGNLVVIEHGNELFTLYAHLSETNVRSGQQVFAGDLIGEVGMTGVAIGSHLHFEVRQGNGQDYFATQNPELWLIPGADMKGNPLGALMVSVMNQSPALAQPSEYTVRYYPDSSGKHAKSYYGMTYPAEMLNGQENMALGDLPAGQYRIAIESNGKPYERWAEVESGKLTQVVIIVK